MTMIPRVEISSRDLKALSPKMQALAKDFLDRTKVEHLDVLIYCTFRSPWSQALLYAQGRSFEEVEQKAKDMEAAGYYPSAELLLHTKQTNWAQLKGPVVTYAGPGESAHQYGWAFDYVPMYQGKPCWGTNLLEDRERWEHCEEIALEVGLAKLKFERPHLQDPDFFDQKEKLMTYYVGVGPG
jgi:peptidoglycan L-alanyl-D-glutamate endopeptidase CwlK